MKNLKNTFLLGIIVSLFFACQTTQEVEESLATNAPYVLVNKGDQIVLFPLAKGAEVDAKTLSQSDQIENELVNANFYPSGVVVTQNTFDVEQSAFGRVYRVAAPGARLANSQEFVLSGIEYPSGTYDMMNGEDQVTPVYNGDTTESLPEGVFELYTETGEFVMTLSEGTLDLRSLEGLGLQGKHKIHYRLFDESQGYEAITQVFIQFVTRTEYNRLMTLRGATADTGGTEEEDDEDASEIVVIVED